MSTVQGATTNSMIAGIVAMGLVVLASNIAIGYPINDWLTWGTFTYPFAFLVTDLTNRLFGPAAARRVVYAGFVTGVVLSLIFANPRIALASGSAFLAAQLLDVAIFDHLRQSTWWKAPLISTVLASAVDTALFYSLAFAGTDTPWDSWAVGDFLAKLLMAAVLLVPFRFLVLRLQHHLRLEPDPGTV